MLDSLLLRAAVGWRRYVELFWYAVESAKEDNIMTKMPHTSDQSKAAIVGKSISGGGGEKQTGATDAVRK